MLNILFLLFCLWWVRARGAASKDDEFLAWFVARGGVLSNVGLGDFEGMGRGVVALSDLRSEDEIIRVPMSIVFSTATLSTSQDPVHQRIASALSPQDDQVVAAALVLERLRGAESAFSPYMQVLPDHVPNFSHFSDDNLSELQDPELEEEVRVANGNVVTRFPSWAAQLASLWPPGVAAPTLEDYRWALSIVDSRGLRFKGRVYLAPMADMFNYGPHPISRPANSGEFFLSHHQLGEKDLVILADRAATKGSQLLEDYGDNKDKIYAQYHGFVTDHNPFRCVTVSGPAFDALSAHARELVQTLRFSQPPQQCLSGDRGVDQLDEGMVVYLSSSAFTAEEASACVALKKVDNLSWHKLSVECGFKRIRELFSAVVGNSVAQPSVDEGKGLAVVPETSAAAKAQSLLHSLVLSLLEQSVRITTIADDEVYLAGLNGNKSQEQERKEMAIRLRLHRKRQLALLAEKLDPSPRQRTSEPASRSLPTDADTFLLQEKLDRFNQWFQAAGPSFNKLSAAYIPGFRVGTVATAPIAVDDQYLGVPTSIIMDSDGAWEDLAGVGNLLKGLSAKYNNARDDFHELLFFLLHQYFVMKEKSRYWPYLALLPTANELDIPLFWSDQELSRRMTPSLLVDGMRDYRNKTRRSFESISALPQVQAFFESFERVLTYENYMWGTAILDSRSIWWNGKRHLVPMLDFVNCAEGPDPAKVHSTKLDDSERNAVTAASWAFAEGEQVFENYGQPNSIYFSYHGFSLPIGKNSHDCVQHKLSLNEAEAQSIDWESNKGLARRIAQRLNFQQSPSTTVCLKKPMHENVWIFFALKMSTLDQQSKANILGRPTPEAESLLADDIAKRIADYEHPEENSSTHPHEPSIKFLASETFLLKELLADLSKNNKARTEL